MTTRAEGIERIACEMLDDVFLGELVAIRRRDELLEFLERLPAEIAAIHEKEDALRAGVFHEAVNEIDGGVGLARAGGHLDERARPAGGEGFLQVRDRLDLRGPEPPRRAAEETRGAAARAASPAAPRRAASRAMEREDAAAARIGIEAAGEEGLRARALVAEGERPFPRGHARAGCQRRTWPTAPPPP